MQGRAEDQAPPQAVSGEGPLPLPEASSSPRSLCVSLPRAQQKLSSLPLGQRSWTQSCVLALGHAVVPQCSCHFLCMDLTRGGQQAQLIPNTGCVTHAFPSAADRAAAPPRVPPAVHQPWAGHTYTYSPQFTSWVSVTEATGQQPDGSELALSGGALATETSREPLPDCAVFCP